jgi:hypothetical protein
VTGFAATIRGTSQPMANDAASSKAITFDATLGHHPSVIPAKLKESE